MRLRTGNDRAAAPDRGTAQCAGTTQCAASVDGDIATDHSRTRQDHTAVVDIRLTGKLGQSLPGDCRRSAKKIDRAGALYRRIEAVAGRIMIEVERALIAQHHSAVNCSGCSRGIARSRANIHDTLRAVLSNLQDAAPRSLSNACAIRHRQRTVSDRTDIDFSNFQ